jgi:predicted amidohydrolase YtcJ
MRYLLTLTSLFIVSIVAGQIPDIILYNGSVFTADKKQLYTAALAIKGDKIMAVGTSESIKKLGGTNTKMIDLEGKTVIPGFNDAHDHTGPSYPARIFTLQQLPTDPTSWENVRDSILQITKELPAGALIRSTINPDLFADPRARIAALDSIAPLHPVILAAWTGHGVIVNSKALALLGYTDQTKLAGGWLEKGGNGKLNGILHEYAAYPIDAMLNGRMQTADVVAGLKKYYAEALSLGITSQQIMATQMPASLFKKIYAAYDFGMRSRIIAFPFTNEKELRLSEWAALFGRLNNKNEISGVKLILDGTPVERLAYLTKPYTDQPNTSGHLDFDDNNIKKFIQYCLVHKQQIMVHAVGDGSIKTMVRLLQSLHPNAFWKDKRVRIEHGDLAIMDAADLQTIQQMGIVIVQNPLHLSLPQVMGPRLGNRTSYLQAMRSLIDNNIPLAFGSDGPINPFLNIMMAAIHPDNPKEAITVEEAVIAYTYGSAFAEFKEKEKGILAPGKLADLAVLSQNIFSVPLNTLPQTQSVLTIVSGKIVYAAAAKK